MALNWTILSPTGMAPLELPEERIYTDFKDVRMDLESGNGFPGAGGVSYCVKSGKIVVSSHRVIYLSSAWMEWSAREALSRSSVQSSSSYQHPPFVGFQSLSVPLRNIKDLKYNQPWLGTKHIQFSAVPVPNGGLVHLSNVKLYFDVGGGFECYSQLCAILDRALVPNFVPTMPTVVPADEPLPLYSGDQTLPPPPNINDEHHAEGLPRYDPQQEHPNSGPAYYTPSNRKS